MSTQKITDNLPLWWLCFLDRINQLRKATRQSDISFFHTSTHGYISGLYCTDTINTSQRILMDIYADNAQEWALKDAEVA